MKDKIVLQVDEKEIRVQLHKIKEINEIFGEIGINIEIGDLQKSGSQHKCVIINYDTLVFEEAKKRKAGRPSKRMKKLIKTEEVCKRMENETASQVAEDLGISRETLYRKLKAAKEYGYEYL